MRFNSVVLPHPLGPSKQMNAFGAASSVMSCNAISSSSPSDDTNIFVTWRTDSLGVGDEGSIIAVGRLIRARGKHRSHLISPSVFREPAPVEGRKTLPSDSPARSIPEKETYSGRLP